MPLPVHVIIEHGHRTAALVGDGNLARHAKGHRPVAVFGPAKGTVADQHGIQVPLVAVPDAEEIAKWNVHARRLLAVVVDAQPDQAGPRKLVIAHSEPDVANDPWPLQ